MSGSRDQQILARSQGPLSSCSLLVYQMFVGKFVEIDLQPSDTFWSTPPYSTFGAYACAHRHTYNTHKYVYTGVQCKDTTIRLCTLTYVYMCVHVAYACAHRHTYNTHKYVYTGVQCNDTTICLCTLTYVYMCVHVHKYVCTHVYRSASDILATH
jgi:hypothetical protein